MRLGRQRLGRSSQKIQACRLHAGFGLGQRFGQKDVPVPAGTEHTAKIAQHGVKPLGGGPVEIRGEEHQQGAQLADRRPHAVYRFDVATGRARDLGRQFARRRVDQQRERFPDRHLPVEVQVFGAALGRGFAGNESIAALSLALRTVAKAGPLGEIDGQFEQRRRGACLEFEFQFEDRRAAGVGLDASLVDHRLDIRALADREAPDLALDLGLEDRPDPLRHLPHAGGLLGQGIQLREIRACGGNIPFPFTARPDRGARRVQLHGLNEAGLHMPHPQTGAMLAQREIRRIEIGGDLLACRRISSSGRESRMAFDHAPRCGIEQQLQLHFHEPILSPSVDSRPKPPGAPRRLADQLWSGAY